MSNLYRGPSIDPSYQNSIYLAKQFSGEDFLKWANQKQELPVAVMFVNESGRNEQPSIDASYQISVHLAEGFHRRRLKCEKTDERRWTPSDGKSSHCQGGKVS
jgi:hypothetical protein